MGDVRYQPCAATTFTADSTSKWENLHYLMVVVCFTWCTLFFQYVCFLLPIFINTFCIIQKIVSASKINAIEKT